MARQNVNIEEMDVQDRDKCVVCESPGKLTVQCDDCKRWAHYTCTKLPLYKLWSIAHSQGIYTCEICCPRKEQDSEQEWTTEEEEALAEVRSEASLGNTSEDITHNLDNKESLPDDETSVPNTPAEDPTSTQTTAQQEAEKPVQSVDDTGPKKSNSVPAIYNLYKTGNCKHGPNGKNCKYSHPKPCQKLMTHGPKSDRGCKMGENCPDFHPNLCWDYIRKYEWFRKSCKVKNIKGTQRSHSQKQSKTQNEPTPPHIQEDQVPPTLHHHPDQEEPSQTNEPYDDQVNSTQEKNELLGLCTGHFSGLKGRRKNTQSAPKTLPISQDEQDDDEILGVCTSKFPMSNENMTTFFKKTPEVEKATHKNETDASPEMVIHSSKDDNPTEIKSRTKRKERKEKKRNKRRRTPGLSDDEDAQEPLAFDDEENEMAPTVFTSFKDNSKGWKDLDKRFDDNEKKTSNKEGISDEELLTVNRPHFTSKMDPEIINDITRDNEAMYAFLKRHQCIRSTAPKCSTCGKAMIWVRRCRDEFVWRCSVHRGQTMTPRSGSFWERSKLSLSTLLRLAFFWSFNTPNKDCKNYTGLSERTIALWYQYFRDVCSHYLVQNPIMIGGPNVLVEIDKSVIPRRKYSGNHIVPERWIFGGICPATQEGFLVFVPDREASTLLSIIQQHVRPGSIILTNGWPIYNGIDKINVQPPYIHQIVNRSVNFGDPVNGASIGHVGNYWKKAKKKFIAMSGVRTDHLDSHLNEFQWRERFGKHGMDVFSNLLLHISQRYPTP